MKRLTYLVATLAIGAACATPVLAQDTGAIGATHGNTSSPGDATAPGAATTAAPGISHTISASQTGSAGGPSTNTMGAGPQDMGRAQSQGDLDIGWMGLLGLFGLLGLRRRRHGGDPRAQLRHGTR